MEPVTSSTAADTGAPPPLAPPANDGGSTRPPDISSGKPPIRYFDFVLHEQVQELHKRGIWCDLGPRLGNLEMRVRPFSVRSVVEKREAKERILKTQAGLADNEELSAADQIEVNKAAVTMAITGCRGRVTATPKQVALAKHNSWQVEQSEAWGGDDTALTGGDTHVIFTGNEDADAVRSFFVPVLDSSMTLLTLLLRASQGLQKVTDQEIGKLGEAFVYGRHAAFSWAD